MTTSVCAAGVAVVLAVLAGVGSEAVAHQAAHHETINCECRANGQSWRQGHEVCLRGTLHVCGMDQNVTSWIQTKKPCPEAGFLKPVRGISNAPQRLAYALEAACFSSARSP